MTFTLQPSTLGSLWLAALIDAVLGEPPSPVHPVVWLGNVIGGGSRWSRTGRPGEELWRGMMVAGGGATLLGITGVGLQHRLRSARFGWVTEGLVVSTLFAWRALDQAAAQVERDLASGELTAARQSLRSLVSRDPETLAAGQIAAAACESVAENLADSLIAPTLAYLIGGLGGILSYRWLNTADAMIGYHGDWEYAGKAAARLDDLVNWIPARLAGLLLLAVAPAQAVRGWQVMRSDHARTASPNAGWTMSALAGILNRELAKPGQYVLNAGAPLPDHHDIRAARRLIGRAWLLWLVIVPFALFVRSRR